MKEEGKKGKRERVEEPASSSSSSSSFSSLRLQMPKSNHPQSPKKIRSALYIFFCWNCQTVLRRSRRESEVYAVPSAYMIINLLLFLTSDTNNNYVELTKKIIIIINIILSFLLHCTHILLSHLYRWATTCLCGVYLHPVRKFSQYKIIFFL